MSKFLIIYIVEGTPVDDMNTALEAIVEFSFSSTAS
jgi:hypothetical protein